MPRGLAVPALFVLAAVPHVLFGFQPFFIDEAATSKNVLEFVTERTLVPLHTAYPTFYSYLATPFMAVGVVVQWLAAGAGSLAETGAQLYYLRPRDFVFPARMLSVLMLLVAAVAVYRSFGTMFGRFPAIAAGLSILVAPAFLAYGSYALPDATLMTLCLLSFVSLVRFFHGYPEPAAVRFFYLASVLAGLAMSTKYNAASAAVPIAVAVGMLVVQGRASAARGFKLLVLAGTCYLAAFVAGSPGWILDPGRLLDGLLFEMRHAEVGHLGESGIPVLGQMELLLSRMSILTVFGILGVALWLRKPSAEGAIALAALVASLSLACLTAKQSFHYLYPSMAGWLYFACLFLAWVHGKVRVLTTVAVAAAGVVFLAGALAKGAIYVTRPQATDLAERWIYDNVPPHAAVAVDWIYVPRLYPSWLMDELPKRFGKHAAMIGQEILATKKLYDVRRIKPAPEWLDGTDAQYLVTGTHAFRRFYCHGRFTAVPPRKGTALRQRFDAERRFYSSLFGNGEWAVAYAAMTGNGPDVFVLRRSGAGTAAAAPATADGIGEVLTGRC